MKKVRLPYKFEPRGYQLPVFQAFDSGIKRGVVVWHRRAGKDRVGLNLTIKKMLERVGGYAHYFPTKVKGREALWDGIGSDGFRYIDHFPPELVVSKSDGEMKIRLRNGSVWQVKGTNDPDAAVGTNEVGMVISEWPLMNPRFWDMARPILRENDGWGLFLYTPRGNNHGKTLYDMAKENADWFCSRLRVLDTRREDGQRIFSDADLAAERAEGMSDELIQQEFFCDFEANIEGAYYGKLLQKAEKDGRITRVPYDPRLAVVTAWDLGMDDANAIWFLQPGRLETRVIDYLEDSGEGLAYYARKLGEREYVYAEHLMPHDVEVRELGPGKSRKASALALGIRPIRVVPALEEHGIEAVRGLLPTCWFDAEKCKQGLEALRNYRKEYDEKAKKYKDHPLHDWTSHAADAFAYFATGFRPKVEGKPPGPPVHGGPGGWMG